MSVLRKGTSLLEEFPVADLYFVGDTSPFGHILQSVVGTKRMVEEALSFNPSLVIVDTSGLVSGALGQALKYYKTQVINPGHIVALQREDELREIIYTLSKSGKWKLHSLPVSSEAKHISPMIRAGIRRERFRRYFGYPNSFKLNLDKVSLYPPLSDFLEREDLRNILVSLKNQRGRVLGIGILKDFFPQENKFEVLAPITQESEIFGVELGFLKVTKDGRELGRAHHHK
jgi:polynucleotide 5'-hydroxyl-kinase GRC3/NOL9